MANKGFNPNVLENVTTFDIPLKECFIYEPILSLIKEEIDIVPTEDELEYQNIEKLCSPTKGTNRKRLNTSESVFKSPYKKKYCSNLKSPGSSPTANKEKPFKLDNKNPIINKGGTLGTSKPRRSSIANQRSDQSSVSHSEASTFSDLGDENVAERPNKILKNDHHQSIVQQNGMEYKHVSSITEPTIDSLYTDDEISVSSKGESTSLATTDPLDVETANDSYVESSQSTQTSSELRQKLNRRYSTIDIKTPLLDVINEVLPTSLIKSEDENEHFSLTLSPSSKSSASTIKKERSTSPVQTMNRKSICRVSPLKNSMHEHEDSYPKGELSALTLRQRRRKISGCSPLKGLTQELENCICNGDYVEMCDSDTESMSFTFEAIQLLNDYEDCNQQANNKIFDKILSSPTRPTAKETPAIVDNLITPTKEQFIQDPLHVDYTNEALSQSKSKKKLRMKKELTNTKTIQHQIDEDLLHINAKAVIKNIPSVSTTKTRLEEEKKGSSKSKVDEKSLHVDVDESMKDNSSKSTKTKLKFLKRNLPVRKCRESHKIEPGGDELNDNFRLMDDGDTSINCLPSSSTENKKDRSAKKSNTSRINSSIKQTRMKERETFSVIGTSHDSFSEDDSDTIKNVASTSTPKKRSKGEEKGLSGSEFDEESLHTDESDEIKYESFKSTEKKSKVSKKKLTALRKCQDKMESNRVEIDEASSYGEDDDIRENFSFTSSTKKVNKMAKEIMSSKRKSTGKKGREESSKFENSKASMYIDDSDTEVNDISATSAPETSNTEMALESNEKSTLVKKSISYRKRSRGRSLKKKPVNMDLSGSESEERLAMKAAELAEKIAAAKKKNALPEDVYQEMLGLSIKVRHVPPPQHDIKDGVSLLSFQEERNFIKYASLNKGRYTTAEDELIKKNWNDFCEDHDWDPDNYKPFLSLKHGKKLIMSCPEERKKFIQFLANGLPNRPLFSVYQRFKRIFDKRYCLYKRYKAKEDEKIIAYTTSRAHSLEPKNARFAELSHIMRRSNASLWKRNKTLKEQTNREKSTVEWNLPLIEKFIRTLLDITISDELIDLKDAFLPQRVWEKMEKKMEIKWDILRKFWDQKLHMQLFAPEPILMNELKIKLIEYMHMKKVKHNRDIRWDDLARYFDGYTIPFLRYVFNMLIIELSRKSNTRDFSAMVEFLHSKKIKYLIEKKKDKCLPRISYKDNKAELVAEDTKG